MELRFLTAPGSKREPASWLFWHKLMDDPAAAIRWVKANANSFRAIFLRNEEAEHREYIARLASTAVRVLGSDGLDLAAFLLTDCVPAAHRKTTAETDDAFRVAVRLISANDVQRAARRLDWLEAARPDYCDVLARNVNAELPEPIQDRARRLVR